MLYCNLHEVLVAINNEKTKTNKNTIPSTLQSLDFNGKETTRWWSLPKQHDFASLPNSIPIPPGLIFPVKGVLGLLQHRLPVQNSIQPSSPPALAPHSFPSLFAPAGHIGEVSTMQCCSPRLQFSSCWNFDYPTGRLHFDSISCELPLLMGLHRSRDSHNA